MFCVKCGKSTMEDKVICESCGQETGFGTRSTRRIKENKRIGMYLTVIGNVFVLLGMMISGILIKTNATTDYVAEVFEPKYYDNKEWTEEELAELESVEAVEEAKEEMEVKGYAYSILEYVTHKSLLRLDLEAKETDTAEEKKEKEELMKDVVVLQRVSSYLVSSGNDYIIWSEDGNKEEITAYFEKNSDQEALDIIEKYNKADTVGIVCVVLAVAAGIGAIVLAFLYKFKLSMLFTLVSTVPVWYMILKLEGNMTWEYMNGMYVFVIGLLLSMFGVLTGGNVDRCKNCNLVLPGGAAFCYKCGEQRSNNYKSSKNSGNELRNFARRWAYMIGIIGNVIMFFYILIPHMKTLVGDETVNVVGLRGVVSGDSFTVALITLCIICCCIALIGAVVTCIYEKALISIGCSIAACAMMLCVMYLAQDAVNIGYTFYIFAAGFLIAMAAGISKLKEKKQEEESV